MSNAYDLMENSPVQEQQPQEDFDKEAWAQRKQQEREDVFALADETALRLNADAGARKGYAATMAALPSHSATNVLLVYAQRPEAQRIGDSAFWSQKGASIKKGERGIAILEPGREYVRDDGSVGNFYDVKKVFDVSQTTARERLGRKNSLSDVLAALVMRTPVAIEPQDAPVEGSVRYDPAQDCILVERGLGDRQLFDGLLVEEIHASMANGNRSYDRTAHEPQAMLAANVVAKRFGLEGPDTDIPPFLGHDADARDIRNALNDARSASSDVATRVGEALAKNRNRDEMVR